MSQEFTFAEVAEHTTKKDLYMVIHDKVYDCTKFVDEHPGGEEVLLDVGGQDGTEAFEDVGHSDEARELLDDMLVGTLKRMPGDPAAPKATTTSSDGATQDKAAASLGMTVWAVVVLGGAIAYGAYQYMQAQQAKQQ